VSQVRKLATHNREPYPLSRARKQLCSPACCGRRGLARRYRASRSRRPMRASRSSSPAIRSIGTSHKLLPPPRPKPSRPTVRTAAHTASRTAKPRERGRRTSQARPPLNTRLQSEPCGSVTPTSSRRLVVRAAYRALTRDRAGSTAVMPRVRVRVSGDASTTARSHSPMSRPRGA
jgi:hypothetical protein